MSNIEKYDPIRVLGEGSFGKVYLMRDKIKRSIVCVKIIKIKNIPKKEREATKVEVDLLRRLHHPNIVRYIDSFLSKNNESLCIVMEYCDGGDLASQVKAARRNLFSESKILNWFVQITLGLHYMHSNKVLHRDLKTQNIFLLGNGRLVLGDLGISKVLDGTMDFAQTCIGTPYYMSPEIFKNKPYSYKSDVWALGCVLYEMTTLNHAFDANSLNGLACKIIKGRYPPIHHKYSKSLRDLIGEMLLINPQQRPDCDQILRKPFIKKHIINFFTDIASRPSASLGEGTMIVKVAVGGNAGALSSDSNMLALRQQLQQLDMTQAVSEAMAPKAAPVDYSEAKKLAKEQQNALKREEEHKKLVESALEKLRVERENRAKERAALAAAAAARNNKHAPSYHGDAKAQANAANRHQERDQRPLVRAGPSQAALNPAVGPSADAMRKDGPVRDGGMNWGDRGRGGAGGQLSRDPSVASIASDRSDRDRKPQPRRAFGEDRDRADRGDRERRLAEEKKKLLEAEAREKAEEQRREEVRREGKAREEARLREEQRQRDEAAAKQKQDQLKAQADAAARRQLQIKQQQEYERQRRKEEIEQLKRDKLELDRRTSENERLREQRRADELRRLEEAKRGPSSQDDKSIASGSGERDMNPRHPRAEEKEMNPKDRVLLRRQEKQAREEQERLDALRDAEAENRKVRAAANNRNRGMYDSSNIAGAAVGKRRGSMDHDPSGPSGSSVEESKYQFEPTQQRGGVGRHGRPSMDVDELGNILMEATKGLQSRYDSPADDSNSHNISAEVTARLGIGVPHNRPPSRGSSMFKDDSEIGVDSDETLSGDDADDLWERRGKNAEGDDGEDEIEDLCKREEELQAELNMTSLRVETLKNALQETKSFICVKGDVSKGRGVGASDDRTGRGGDGGRGSVSVAGRIPPPEYDNDDFEEEDDFEDDDKSVSDDSELQDSWGPSRSAIVPISRPKGGDAKDSGPSDRSGGSNVMRTPQKKPMSIDANAPYAEPSYSNLQDPPTPSGRLGERILALRQRCIEALGRDAFSDAYAYLKQQDYEASEGRGLYEEDQEDIKMARIKGILGDGKAHYISLIDQLIFMEESHSS